MEGVSLSQLNDKNATRFVSKMSKTIQDSLAKATAFAQESIMNLRTVRAFAQEEFAEGEYARYVEESFALGRKRAIGQTE